MNTTPTLEMLDPATLTVDINVRKDAALTPDFIASIKEHGVMEPVIAHRKEDGTVHVLMGQRRTRAAVEAGRISIPVMIIESPEEAERIVTQVVENIQRAALTEADEAEAYHQLSLIGVSAATIAKKTGPSPPGKAPATHHLMARNLPKFWRSAARCEPKKLLISGGPPIGATHQESTQCRGSYRQTRRPTR